MSKYGTGKPADEDAESGRAVAVPLGSGNTVEGHPTLPRTTQQWLSFRSGALPSQLPSAPSSRSDDESTIDDLEGDEPLQRFVTRKRSFTKEDFEVLLQHPDLYKVHNLMGSGLTSKPVIGSALPSPRQPLVEDGSSDSTANRARSLSVFGLPTFRPDSALYKYWSSVILVLDLTYSAFVVPISIGMMTSFLSLNWTSFLDYSIGAIFLTDLVVSFHSGFIATYNLRKVLVMNGKLIASFYIRHDTFIFDLLSSLAWVTQIMMLILYHTVETFNPEVALFVMEALRLLRFLRVIKLIRRLLVNSVYAPLNSHHSWFKWTTSPTFNYLFYILYVIAVLVNFLGCLWNFVAGAEGFERTWANYYPPFIRRYAPDGVSPLSADQLQNEVSEIWRYFVGTYWALTTIATVGFGDVTPATIAETVVVMGVEIIGILFFGILISTISELLSNLNKMARRAHTFRKKLTSVERWLQMSDIPRRLQRRIKSYYAEIWLHQLEAAEGSAIFAELPSALQAEVAWAALRDPFKMAPVRFGPGEDVVSEGEPADHLWVLLEVTFVRAVYNILYDLPSMVGDVFGMQHREDIGREPQPTVLAYAGILQDKEPIFRLSPCTLRTLSSCMCWQVRWKDFRYLLAHSTKTRDLVEAHAMDAVIASINLYPYAWKNYSFELRELEETRDRVVKQLRPEVPEDEEELTHLEVARQSMVRFSLPGEEFAD